MIQMHHGVLCNHKKNMECYLEYIMLKKKEVKKKNRMQDCMEYTAFVSEKGNKNYFFPKFVPLTQWKFKPCSNKNGDLSKN